MDSPDHEQEKIERLRRAMYSRRLSEGLHERPRRTLGDQEAAVQEDWTRTEEKLAGVTVAPRYIGATRTALWWVLIASISFFVFALGAFLYYFTIGGGGSPANPSNIDIAISGPPQVAGGEPTELQVVVTNRNRVALQLADLVVTFPSGTRSVTDYATDMPSLRQSLGSIEAGGRRQGTISAVFPGSQAREKQKIQVELEYRIQGSSAIYVAKKEYALTYGSSPLSVSIDGNTQTVSGQPMAFTVNVTSNAGAPVKDVLLTIDYPFGFVFSSASPAPSFGKTWELGDFAPGQLKSVQLQGVLSGDQGDSRVFRLTAGTRASAGTSTIQTKLADNTHAVQISQQFLGLAISINKRDDSGAPTDANFAQGASKVPGVAAVSAGQTVTVTIDYQNNLSAEIRDAVVVARLSGMQIDNTTVRSTNGFYRSSDDAVLWDKTTTNGSLAVLKPGDKGSLTFSFQIPKGTSLASMPYLDISANAAGKRLSETGVPQNLQSTARQRLAIATDLQVAAQALYYANPFVSTGPMPAKVGVETTYALVFTVTNTTNKIKGAKVTATLPPYVRWIGSHAPGFEKLTYNQTDGTFVWDLGDVEAGAGTAGSQPRQMAVSIGFTPSASQIGEKPALIHAVTLTGIDSVTGETVTKVATPDVNTNLSQLSKSSEDSLLGTDIGFSPANAAVVK